jgi:hypothetical protein
MPRVTRIGLVSVSHPTESVRRFRLARLEEVSLATPPNGAPRQTIEPFAVLPLGNPSGNGLRDRRVS